MNFGLMNNDGLVIVNENYIIIEYAMELEKKWCLWINYVKWTIY